MAQLDRDLCSQICENLIYFSGNVPKISLTCRKFRGLTIDSLSKFTHAYLHLGILEPVLVLKDSFTTILLKENDVQPWISYFKNIDCFKIKTLSIAGLQQRPYYNVLALLDMFTSLDLQEFFIQTCSPGYEIFYSLLKIVETNAQTLKVCLGLLPELLNHISCNIKWDVFSLRPKQRNYKYGEDLLFRYGRNFPVCKTTQHTNIFTTSVLQITCIWSDCSFLYNPLVDRNFTVQDGVNIDEIQIITSRPCWNYASVEYSRNLNLIEVDIASTNPGVKTLYIEISEVNRYTLLDCLPYYMLRFKKFFPNLTKCTLRLVKNLRHGDDFDFKTLDHNVLREREIFKEAIRGSNISEAIFLCDYVWSEKTISPINLEIYIMRTKKTLTESGFRAESTQVCRYWSRVFLSRRKSPDFSQILTKEEENIQYLVGFRPEPCLDICVYSSVYHFC